MLLIHPFSILLLLPGPPFSFHFELLSVFGHLRRNCLNDLTLKLGELICFVLF